jgi:hypothetical protein
MSSRCEPGSKEVHSMKWWARTFCIFVGLSFLVGTAAAAGGTVWLTADIRSAQGRAEIRLPLEWLAGTRTKEEPTLRVGDVRIDCIELWNQYRDLAVGQKRLVLEGTTEQDEKYTVDVVSDPPAPAATGKVRILNRDENGKETEVGFPLSFAKVLDGLSKIVPHWLDDDDESNLEKQGLSLSGNVEFTKLADYGAFTALDARDAKSRVRVTIE